MSCRTLRPRATFLAWLNVALALIGVSSAQELPKPIGEEAFGVLRAFYGYDPEIPLEARVVELRDESTSMRRKVVFRGARGFLVPGLLEMPKRSRGSLSLCRVDARLVRLEG